MNIDINDDLIRLCREYNVMVSGDRVFNNDRFKELQQLITSKLGVAVLLQDRQLEKVSG